MDSIGERIKEVRNRQHLTQSQFACEVAISQTHVSKIEKDVEHPSATLLRLISVKYNISEQWLLDGKGSPEPEWDMSTDEGAIAKYNAMRVSFERKLQARKGKDLSSTVEAFAYLDALIDARKLGDEDTTRYLESACMVIDLFEKLTFKTSCDKSLLPSKRDAQNWLRFKNECDSLISNMAQSAKEAANLYLARYGEEMKL